MTERTHVARLGSWPDDPAAAAAALEHEKRNAKRTIRDGHNLGRLPDDVSDVEVVSIERVPGPEAWGAVITFRLGRPSAESAP